MPSDELTPGLEDEHPVVVLGFPLEHPPWRGVLNCRNEGECVGAHAWMRRWGGHELWDAIGGDERYGEGENLPGLDPPVPLIVLGFPLGLPPWYRDMNTDPGRVLSQLAKGDPELFAVFRRVIDAIGEDLT